MRKHGWQLPYHPLQVVAIAVFLALGFAFYVFFAPFVGKQLFQYIAIGIYTPLIVCAFGLYIWCAVVDPGDPGVFRSKKYLCIPDTEKQAKLSDRKHEGELGDSTPSVRDANDMGTQENTNDQSKSSIEARAHCDTETGKTNLSFCLSSYLFAMSALALCSSYACDSCKDSAGQQESEDGMFYCSLCEVEVFMYSKHCRVCDKCVDCFDHHCRWINNCIGKRNYRIFFTLMVFALLMLILQWSTGILVLILCFVKRKEFAADISSKLGSGFTVVPFVIVVAACTLLAIVATLPLAQLFSFHIILIKKGISTYDYIVALREQEQEAAEGQHSPQMSTVSSITGLSSASSFNNFQRAAWCTPPRLFLDDQFDAIPPDNGSVSSLGKRTMEESSKKKNSAPVKISPWALARLNTEDVSRAASEARKNSKILRPAIRHGSTSALETNDTSFGSSGRRIGLRPDKDQRRGSKHIHLPIPEPVQMIPTVDGETGRHQYMITETARALTTSRAVPCSVGTVDYSSSPESSLGSPEIQPLRASSSGAEPEPYKEIPLLRSNSEGYDASGGEDSDQEPTRILHRTVNWSSLIHGPQQDETVLPNAHSSKHEAH